MIFSLICDVEGGSCQLIGSPVDVNKVNQSREGIKVSDADKDSISSTQRIYPESNFIELNKTYSNEQLNSMSMFSLI